MAQDLVTSVLLRLPLRTSRARHLRLRLDLDEVLVAHQLGGDQRVGGLDAAEALAVRAGHGLPVIEASDEDPRADDVVEPGAERLQRALDLVDREVSLRGGI